MKDYRLSDMVQNAIAFDLETHLIQPGLMAPPLVLGSAAEWDGTRIQGVILDKTQVRDLFVKILDTPEAVLAGANIAYDLLVMLVDFAKRGIDVAGRIFAMYDPEMTIVRGHCDGRVFEIQLAEPLDAIANGHLGKHRISGETMINKQTGRPARYSLDKVTFEVQNREDAKTNDRFRLAYAQFDDVPIAQLPFEARTYPIDDSVNTLGDALGQAGHLPSVNRHEWIHVHKDSGLVCRHCKMPCDATTPQACMRKQRRRNLQGLSQQAYFAWAVHIGAAWGLNVPQDEVDKLEKRIDAAREIAVVPYKAAGIVRENGSVNEAVLKRMTAIAYGARDQCPECINTRTKKGEPKPGKVISQVTGNTFVNCKACDGSGLRLPPECPRTPSGEIACGRDALCESGDEFLMEYGEQPSRKIKTTFIPLLRRGRACNVCGKTGCATKYSKAHEDWCTAQENATYRPVPLCPRVNPLLETERSAIEEGLHSMPRKGGVRECFVARPGYVYSSEDYTAGELVTLAQNCLWLVGYSKLAEALNHGIDVHTALAGTLCGKPYEVMMAAKKAKEKWVDDLRQVGKKSNFGFGGGMAELEFVLKPCRADPDLFTPCPGGPSQREMKIDGVKTIVEGFNGVRPCILMDHEDFCGRQGDKVLEYNDKPTRSPVCIRCLRAGKRAREAWFTQWPEMRDYFKVIKKVIADEGPSGTPELVYHDGMVRGGVGFCDAANGHFQRTLAKAAKAAFCQVQRECVVRGTRVRSSEMMPSRFDGAESPLYGSRAILLFHDEIISEHPLAIASEAAIRQSEIMVEALRWQCPDMYKAVAADPALMPRLYKGAEAVWERGGKKPADSSDRLVPREPS